MKNTQEQLEALTDIRNMMDRSSRFISLSGLSGIFAGIIGLAGAFFAHKEITDYLNTAKSVANNDFLRLDLEANLIKIAIVTLLTALLGGIFFTYRQSRKRNLPIWDRSSKNLLINLLIPLASAGLFIIALLINTKHTSQIIAPLCLVFYGLTLINAGKYTYSDIRFLGFCEVLLGIANLFYIECGLYFWAFGFGILHILYGAIMYFKYEKAR